jgi:hypothetical protein
MPSKEQIKQERTELINDLTLLIAKANALNKWTIAAAYLRLKESVTADLKSMG